METRDADDLYLLCGSGNLPVPGACCLMSYFPLGSEQKAGRQFYVWPSAAVTVELGCDVLDKRADQAGQGSPLSGSISQGELL